MNYNWVQSINIFFVTISHPQQEQIHVLPPKAHEHQPQEGPYSLQSSLYAPLESRSRNVAPQVSPRSTRFEQIEGFGRLPSSFRQG